MELVHQTQGVQASESPPRSQRRRRFTWSYWPAFQKSAQVGVIPSPALPVSRYSEATKSENPTGPPAWKIAYAKEHAVGPPTFSEAFGKLGVPLVAAICISILWTVWLIQLNIAPTRTVNALMDTADIDNGHFWLIQDPEPLLLVFTVLNFGVLAICYTTVVLNMTVWRNSVTKRSFGWSWGSLRALGEMVEGNDRSRLALSWWKDATSFSGRHRKCWCGYFSLHVVALYRIQDQGFPTTICYCFCLLVATNALSCAIFILSPFHHSALTEVFVDTGFDMMFAVVLPILLLSYSKANFQFDHERARLILEMTPSGSFMRQSRLMSDPLEITLFRISFNGLRVKSWVGLCVQSTMSASLCYRLKRVADIRIEQHQADQGETQTEPQIKLIPMQTQVPRVVAIFFLLSSAGVLIYTSQSVRNSQEACSAYPQCLAHSYRWVTYDLCPCLALIDAERAPKSYEAWTNPPDVAPIVRELARWGKLEVLELINRRMLEWPDQLQLCKDLHHLLLLYTGVQTIPDWAKKLTQLQVLTIEGNPMDTNLVTVPNDLFKDMSMLEFLHLGVHPRLERLPSLQGLTNLQYLAMASMSSAKTLPCFESLTRLKRLMLVGIPRAAEIPDLAPLSQLEEVSIQLSAACCNGFVKRCDRDATLCADPAFRCIPEDDTNHQPSAKSRRYFDAHSEELCVLDLALAVIPYEVFFEGPTREEVEVCSGVLYRECYRPSHREISMCINNRMHAIGCTASDTDIDLRKAEISRNLGTPCDPEEEA